MLIGQTIHELAFVWWSMLNRDIYNFSEFYEARRGNNSDVHNYVLDVTEYAYICISIRTSIG